MKIERLLMLTSALCIFACEDTESSLESDAEIVDHDFIEDLAWRYLYLEVEEEGSVELINEFESLNPDELRAFMHELQMLQGASPSQVEMSNQITELAISQGVPPTALNGADVQTIVDDIKAEFGSPRAFCSVWNPGSTTTLHGLTSNSSGTTASGSDRMSTSWFEYGGCDHRFHFLGTKDFIDGKTAAYDNWIASYPSILGKHTGGLTYALMGNYRAEQAGIYSVNYTKLKAY